MRIVAGKQKGVIAFRSVYDSDKMPEAWMRFCKALGKELSSPKHGFLSSYVCQFSGSSPPSSSPSWRIEVIEGKDALELQVSFLLARVSQNVRSLSFPIHASVLKNLNSGILPVAIARMLVEENPTGWLYKHTQDAPSFDMQGEGEPLLLPHDLLIYDLYYEKKEQLWLPRLRALISKDDDRGEGGEDSDQVKYSVATSYRPLQRGRSYWIRGLISKERENKYRKIILEALQGKRDEDLPEEKGSEETLSDDPLSGPVRSNYAGARYGKSIAQSDSIVTRADMVSVFAEVGNGSLKGLRGSYDLFPKVKSGSGNEEEYFSLKRASLGWAFNFQMPAPLRPFLTKMDIQPKIGLLDLKSRFSTSTSTGKAGLDFNATNTYDLAIEAGVEKTSSWFRSRLWGGLSTANFGVSNASSVTVKSSRGGMDLYFNLFRSEAWDANLLTFVAMERLEFAKDPNALKSDTIELYSISSNLIFAGLGFTLAW